MDNYIIVRERGNTYVGGLATKFSYNGKRSEIEALVSLDLYTESLANAHPLGQFVVVEFTNGELIVRARQSTCKAASKYMDKPNRICVWHEALENVNDEKEMACRLASWYCKHSRTETIPTNGRTICIDCGYPVTL